MNTLWKLRILEWYFFLRDNLLRAQNSSSYMINPLDLYFRSLIQTIDIVVKLPSDATSVEEPLVEKSIQKMTDSRFLVIQQFCTNFAIACPVNPTKVLHCLYVDIGGRSLKVSSLTKYTFLLIVRIPQTCDKLMITTKRSKKSKNAIIPH